jgi:hypothetical protein
MRSGSALGGRFLRRDTLAAKPTLALGGRLKYARSCSKCNRRLDLLQNPIGTLVGTTAIAAKCEDVSLSENLSMGTRGVLILPSIRCRAPHCTINPDVCHEDLLLEELKSCGAFVLTKRTMSRRFLSRNRALKGRCFLAQLLGELVNIHGMLVRLFAELVSSLRILFAMGDSRCRVRVGRKVVEFCSLLVWSL